MNKENRTPFEELLREEKVRYKYPQRDDQDQEKKKA